MVRIVSTLTFGISKGFDVFTAERQSLFGSILVVGFGMIAPLPAARRLICRMIADLVPHRH